MQICGLLVSVVLSATLSFTSMALETPTKNSQSAHQPPATFEAEYAGFAYGKELGEASMTLSVLEDGRYQLAYDSKVAFFFLSDKRHELSTFVVKNNQIIPNEYEFLRKGTGKDKSIKVTFDTTQQTINVNGKSQEWLGEFDNQIYRLDLQKRLAAGEQDFNYAIINNRGDRREYQLKVMGKEQLELPYGLLEGIKIEIIRDAKKKRKTFVWFSPELNFQLVRLQQFKEGEEQGDIRLKSFNLTSE